MINFFRDESTAKRLKTLMPVALSFLLLILLLTMHVEGNAEPATCRVPLDIAFAIDDTGSMGGAINNVKQEINAVIELIENISRREYRLALLTFKDNVTLRVGFAYENKEPFISALQTLSANGGAGEPEASDEALNEALLAMPPRFSDPLQIIVLITDARPGGVDDQYTEGVDDVRAHNLALAALGREIKIGAIYVPTSDFYSPTIIPIMQDYARTSEGFYAETEPDGTGAGAAIRAVIEQIACGGGAPPPPPPVSRRCTDKIFYASDTSVNIPPNMGIFSMRPDDGGEKTRLTSVPDASRQHDLNPEVSHDGCWVAWERHRDNVLHQVWVMYHDGSYAVDVTPPGAQWAAKPAWAYDNFRLALIAEAGATAQLFTTNRQGDEHRQLTTSATVRFADTPSWSPTSIWSNNEERIVFVNVIEGRPQIYTIGVNSLELDKLVSDANWNIYPRWSPNGSRIMFTRLLTPVVGNPGEIYTVNPAEDPNHRFVSTLVSTADALYPAWSRTGNHIAYVYRNGNNSDLKVMDWDGSNQRRLTTAWRIDHRPAWLRFRNDRDPDQGEEPPPALTTRIAVGSNHAKNNFEVFSVPILPASIINLTTNPGHIDFRPHQ